MLVVKVAESTAQINGVRHLLEEYGELRQHDAALGDYTDELAQLPGKYAAPEGSLLLATWNEQPAGCVAIRKIGEGICEMKRMYVSPGFRKKGVGQALVEGILKEARARNYEIMRLDTHPWMEAAQKLYQSFGFKEVEAYHYNPTPGIRFFELLL